MNRSRFARTVRHRALLCLLVIVFAANAAACASSMTDAEAASILQELLPRSQELNRIFFGEGLPLENPDASPLHTVDGAQYYAVSQDAPYRSVAQIKAEAEAVFTEAYLKTSVYPMAFDGVEDYQPRYAEQDGRLVRNILSNAFDLSGTFDLSTVHVSDAGYGMVEVEIDYRRDGTVMTVTLALRQQNGVWLLDSPTY